MAGALVKKGDTILVTGAAGFVGSYVVKELLEVGYKVRAFVRESTDFAQLSDRLGVRENEIASFPNLSLHFGDIRDIAGIREALTGGVDGVLHIAALFRQAKHPDQVYHDINVSGTENVLRAASEAGVKAVVHCSTVGVHSHIPKPPAGEEEEYRPGDIYQESKCEGEKLALDWFRNRGLHGVVIRPAMIWGPGDARVFKMFNGIRRGIFPLIGDGNTLFHWIDVRDLARSFRQALEAEIPSGEVFIISGREDIRLLPLIAKIEHALIKLTGWKPPTFRLSAFPIPAWPIQLAGSLCELLCLPFNIEPPLHRRRVDFYTKTRSFTSEKARRMLGFAPKGDIDSEIEAIIQWYEAHHWKA